MQDRADKVESSSSFIRIGVFTEYCYDDLCFVIRTALSELHLAGTLLFLPIIESKVVRSDLSEQLSIKQKERIRGTSVIIEVLPRTKLFLKCSAITIYSGFRIRSS